MVMEHAEAVAILHDLKSQFEILDDLANMDWMIFTYQSKVPWFYLNPQEASEHSSPNGWPPSCPTGW